MGPHPAPGAGCGSPVAAIGPPGAMVSNCQYVLCSTTVTVDPDETVTVRPLSASVSTVPAGEVVDDDAGVDEDDVDGKDVEDVDDVAFAELDVVVALPDVVEVNVVAVVGADVEAGSWLVDAPVVVS